MPCCHMAAVVVNGLIDLGTLELLKHYYTRTTIQLIYIGTERTNDIRIELLERQTLMADTTSNVLC